MVTWGASDSTSTGGTAIWFRQRRSPPWPDGPLRLHRPRRHLGKTLQHESAADVLQPDSGRPERPPASLPRWPGSHALRRRGENLHRRRSTERPSRSPRALIDPSDSNHLLLGSDGGVSTSLRPLRGPGGSMTTSRSPSSTRSASTTGVHTGSVVDSKTTGHGAVPPIRSTTRAYETPTGRTSKAETDSTFGSTQATQRSSTSSPRTDPSGGSTPTRVSRRPYGPTPRFELNEGTIPRRNTPRMTIPRRGAANTDSTGIPRW